MIWNYSLFSVYTIWCIFHSDVSIPILSSTMDTLTGGLFQHQCTAVSQHHFNVFIVLLLLCVQVTRRLYECLCVSVFSSSRMHLVHYALGLYFYTAVGPTALLHLKSGESYIHVADITALCTCTNYSMLCTLSLVPQATPIPAFPCCTQELRVTWGWEQCTCSLVL